MNSYKEYNKVCIGSSDIASLVLVGYRNGLGADCQMLHFGEDGDYYAYMVNSKDIEIGEHYTMVAEFDGYMRIYDDDCLFKKIKAEHIKVYRAGEMGCIIQFF